MTFLQPWSKLLIVSLLAVAMLTPVTGRVAQARPSQMESQLRRFFVDKEQQSRELAKGEQREMPDEVWDYFEAGKEGRWEQVVELYRDFKKRSYQFGRNDPEFRTTVWQTINETYGAYEQYERAEEKYLLLFAKEITGSVPKGSIFFGGTDPGRFLITAFMRSHSEGDPFFVMTQNPLVDGLYLQYLRRMFGAKISVPTTADAERAFNDYARATQPAAGKSPGSTDGAPVASVQAVGGQSISVSGDAAIFDINGRIAKLIFDRNPNHNFYVEESFPLNWMYPHLLPHGLILQLNHSPLETIPTKIVTEDMQYWNRHLSTMIGNWLNEKTTITEVCGFTARVFVDNDFAEFDGDRAYVQNHASAKTFSKLRTSIASLYAWRASEAKSPEERERMNRAADFAFRQAVALCPFQKDTVLRYVAFLKKQKRREDTLLVARIAEKADPTSRDFAKLMLELE